MKYKLGEKQGNLFKIIALKDFLNIKIGDTGGWIESEANLSQSGNARVSDNARVYDNARVCGDAWVSGNARVYDNTLVSGSLKVTYTPLNIYGLKYNITIFKNHIQAGCHLRTTKNWKALDSFEGYDTFFRNWKIR